MCFIFSVKRPTPPLFVGGAEVTHNYLAENLAAKGYRVVFFGSLRGEGYPTEERYQYYINSLKNNCNINNLSIEDGKITYTYKGIECYLFYYKDFISDSMKVISSIKNVQLLVSSLEDSDAIIKAAKNINIKTAGWLHSDNKEGMQVKYANPDILFSTSKFIRNKAGRKYLSNNYVFYPGFEEVQLDEITRGTAITFINPVQDKGADFVLSLAKSLPNKKFIAVEGWYKNDAFYNNITPNIAYISPQQDLKDIWKQTQILIVPSLVNEAFGRVIVEASLHGIPVIANNKGGIKEALNKSGILMNNLNTEEWIEKIKFCEDAKNYQILKKQAIQSSKKFIRDIVKEFISLI